METGNSEEAYKAQLVSPFFRLPQELRDKVYQNYVREDDGYWFDPRSKKLRLKDGRPIDLAL